MSSWQTTDLFCYQPNFVVRGDFTFLLTCRRSLTECICVHSWWWHPAGCVITTLSTCLISDCIECQYICVCLTVSHSYRYWCPLSLTSINYINLLRIQGLVVFLLTLFKVVLVCCYSSLFDWLVQLDSSTQSHRVLVNSLCWIIIWWTDLCVFYQIHCSCDYLSRLVR